jgi:hypothetical protein
VDAAAIAEAWGREMTRIGTRRLEKSHWASLWPLGLFNPPNPIHCYTEVCCIARPARPLERGRFCTGSA